MPQVEPEAAHDSETFPLPSFLQKPGVVEILLCALTFLAYVGTLAFGFVYDDQPVIVKNAAIHSWRYAPHYFLPAIAADLPQEIVGGAGTFYRPLTLLWLRTIHALFGLNPAGWHLATVAAHVLVTYLVFLLACRLTRERSTALIAGILFGLHPAHVENVAWVSAVNDLLVSGLVLAAFLVYWKKGDTGKKVWPGCSLGLFALALFAKETAVVFPLLIFAYASILKRPQPQAPSTEADLPRSGIAPGSSGLRAALGRGIRESRAYFGVLLLYGMARWWMFRGLPRAFVPLAWSTMVLTWPSVLWFDLRHLALPLRTSEFYSLPYVTSLGQGAFWWPLVLLAASAIAAVWWISRLQRPPVARFAAVWVLLPLLPTLYLRAVAPADFVHDRFLYLPSAGWVIWVALTVRELPRKFRRLRPAARQWGLVALLAAACLLGTWSNELPWGSDLLLYQRGLESAPGNLSVRDNFANVLVGMGRFDHAIPIYWEVLKRDPKFWRSNYNLGYAYYRIGDFPRAEACLRRAIAIDGRDPDQFIYLACAQLREGKLDDAAQSARQALARSPSAPGYRLVLGMILAAQGGRAEAIKELQLELLAHPEEAAAESELQRLRR